MKIAVGSDHAGYYLKAFILAELGEEGYETIDCGTDSPESVDYPDYAGEVCRRVVGGEVDYGVVICSTGIGVSIAANKVPGIRAALCHTEFSAFMARRHNNANVLALGGNVLGNLLARSITLTFIDEHFSHGERHVRRIKKISGMEEHQPES